MGENLRRKSKSHCGSNGEIIMVTKENVTNLDKTAEKIRGKGKKRIYIAI